MGNFSYICPECENPINVGYSDSGEHCILFLVVDGNITEWMTGNYDGYGRVQKPLPHFESEEWITRPWSEFDSDHPQYGNMASICSLIFSGDTESGLAAYHSDCWKGHGGRPEISERDPCQGFGEVTYPTYGGHQKSKFQHKVMQNSNVKWSDPE